MIKFPAYAFLTGLYFSTLQFCYLILLQINISSTYLTYMVITVSWLADSIIGVGLGLFCYYSVYALVSNMPFSSFTLALAAVGSGVTGLWAGRFFIFVLHQYKQVDRIFFHENKGFWVGIVTFFLGFTLLGRPFVFWAPMTLAGILLLNHLWIKGGNKLSNQ